MEARKVHMPDPIEEMFNRHDYLLDVVRLE